MKKIFGNNFTTFFKMLTIICFWMKFFKALRYTQGAITFFTHLSCTLSYSFTSFPLLWDCVPGNAARTFYVIKFIHMQIDTPMKSAGNMISGTIGRPQFLRQCIQSVKGQISIPLQYSITPVSYTHLDVYKRQVQSGVN